jgi:hypothetical protein
VRSVHSLISPSNLVTCAADIFQSDDVVAVGSNATTCVPVRSSTTPDHTVERPLIVQLATLASFAFVVCQSFGVQVAPLQDTIIPHLSQSVRAGIVKSPLPRTVTELIVLILVQDTSVSCFQAISLASSLSAFRLVKLLLNLVISVSAGVSDVERVEIVDIMV